MWYGDEEGENVDGGRPVLVDSGTSGSMAAAEGGVVSELELDLDMDLELEGLEEGW